MEIVSTKSCMVTEDAPDTNRDNDDLDIYSRVSSNHRSYIEFDISSIPGTINKALLWLYCYIAPNYNRTHEARRVTSSWNESNITWNTGQPTVTNTNLASRAASLSDDDSWVSWDVTSMLGDESGATLGIQLRDQTEGCTSGYPLFLFYDDEHSPASYRPILEINGYYVKIAGDDTKDGFSWANAWKTINKAATTVADGSTVHIGFGTYDAEPAGNKIAPQNIGASGIYYKPETAETGGGTGTVSVEQNA
jgi:hypothetical protein